MTRTTKEERDRWVWLASHYISQGELCCFNNKCVIDLLADFEELERDYATLKDAYYEGSHTILEENSYLRKQLKENDWQPIEENKNNAG